jgi:hypothetical protein
MRYVHSLEQAELSLDARAPLFRTATSPSLSSTTPFENRSRGLSEKAYREPSSETGIGLKLLQAIGESTGLARPGPDDLAWDELDLVALVRMSLAAGAEPLVLGRLRVWVRAFVGALMQASITLRSSPRSSGGLGESEMMQAGWRLGERRRGRLAQQASRREGAFWTRAVTRGSPRSGVTKPPRRWHRHGGRPIKWLRDGVALFQGTGRRRAFGVRGRAFGVRDGGRVPAADLPPAHVGIDAGPLIFQGGDDFGRTVSMGRGTPRTRALATSW